MTFGSLFTGIGGLDLGLERAGMECRWQVEIEPYCVRVLEKHWPDVKRYGDIGKIEGGELERVDLICGGYPCQPFSQAGQRKGSADARHLWPEFARIIRLLRPRYVLLENVPGHLSLGFGDVLGDLAGLGFDAEWTCVRAADVGASHLRKRVFVVAYATGLHGEQLARLRSGPRDAEGGRSCSESPGQSFNVAHGETRGRGERGQPSGSGGFTDGRNAELADASRDARDGSHRQDGPRRGVCETGDDVADTTDSIGRRGDCGTEAGTRADSIGRRGDCGTEAGTRADSIGRRGSSGSIGALADAEREGLEIGNGQREQHARQDAEFVASSLPFAPGPNDPRWGAILTSNPDLSPALESPVRGVAHGLPDWVDRALSNRTKRLKALGNAVVPQVAEFVGRRILQAFGDRGHEAASQTNGDSADP